MAEQPLLGVDGDSTPLPETVYQSAQETEPVRIQQITRYMNTIWTDLAHNDYLQILAETGPWAMRSFSFFDDPGDGLGLVADDPFWERRILLTDAPPVS